MASHVVHAEKKFFCTLESLTLIQKQDSFIFRSSEWSPLEYLFELIEGVLSVNRHSEEIQIHGTANEYGFGREFLSVVTQRKEEKTLNHVAG